MGFSEGALLTREVWSLVVVVDSLRGDDNFGKDGLVWSKGGHLESDFGDEVWCEESFENFFLRSETVGTEGLSSVRFAGEAGEGGGRGREGDVAGEGGGRGREGDVAGEASLETGCGALACLIVCLTVACFLDWFERVFF